MNALTLNHFFPLLLRARMKITETRAEPTNGSRPVTATQTNFQSLQKTYWERDKERSDETHTHTQRERQ